jgi:uncharacterized membrane protein
MDSSPNLTKMALIQAKIIADWTKIATILSGTYITLALLAPILMSTSLQQTGQLLYRFYSAVCHQDASKSWFFSANSMIPGKTIFTSLEVTFPNTVTPCVECSAFLGAPGIGWKAALCHRCTAIYLGVFGASLIYHQLKSRHIRIPRLPTYLYLIIGLSPIIADTVLLTNSLNAFTTSTLHLSHILSTITGGLFGAMSIWYAYPQIERHCQKYIYKLSQQRLTQG